MNKLNLSTSPINILVIEDNPGDYFLLEEYIEEMFSNSKITHVLNYSCANDVLKNPSNSFDTILLDASLPDNQGLTLISDVLLLADQCPVLILTGYENLDFSIDSLSLGVSEYLLKDEISAYSLYKSILFSIERKKHIKSIEESEKRYSELFHLSPIPIWVYDVASLQIIQVNFAAIEHYGYSESEFLAMSILNLHIDLAANDIVEIHCQSYFDSANTIRHQLKDGKVIQVKIRQNYINIDGRPCCMMISNDITELIETQESLCTSYKNIIKIEEKEKEKFAAELHDGLAQNIVSAKLIFSFLMDQFPFLAKENRAILIDDTLQGALDECRDMIREIRPKKIIENGFYTEIEILIEKIKATGNIEVNLTNKADIDSQFEYFDLMHIYRITQELFNNSLKHASANKFDLTFSQEDKHFELLYKDNGTGISKDILDAKSSFLSLKRRVQVLGATMELTSTPKNGVTFKIQIPVKL